MLERMKDVGPSIDGVRATGKITKDDYDSVFLPLMEEAHREGRKIRLLYQLDPDLEGFSAGAAWEDMRLGLGALSSFERCAVISDNEWVRNSVRWLGAMVPFPVHAFSHREREGALSFLRQPTRATNLTYHLDPESGVLSVELIGPLRAEDFDALESVVDPWIGVKGNLQGVVIKGSRLPRWQDLGSFIRHMRFVRDHQQKIQRIAIAIDGNMPALIAKISSRFVGAELKQFPRELGDEALAWATGKQTKPAQAEQPHAERPGLTH